MKMHKLEVYVVDFEDYGVEEYVNMLYNHKYGNFQVKHHETADIGEWSDGHPLNFRNTPPSEFRRYFGKVAELISRLRRRAEIRRQIPTRKSVQEGKPDRISDLLEEAANALEQ